MTVKTRPCFICNGTGEMCDVCGEAENTCLCDTHEREAGNPQTFSPCEFCDGTGSALTFSFPPEETP